MGAGFGAGRAGPRAGAGGGQRRRGAGPLPTIEGRAPGRGHGGVVQALCLGLGGVPLPGTGVVRAESRLGFFGAQGPRGRESRWCPRGAEGNAPPRASAACPPSPPPRSAAGSPLWAHRCPDARGGTNPRVAPRRSAARVKFKRETCETQGFNVLAAASGPSSRCSLQAQAMGSVLGSPRGRPPTCAAPTGALPRPRDFSPSAGSVSRSALQAPRGPGRGPRTSHAPPGALAPAQQRLVARPTRKPKREDGGEGRAGGGERAPPVALPAGRAPEAAFRTSRDEGSCEAPGDTRR